MSASSKRFHQFKKLQVSDAKLENIALLLTGLPRGESPDIYSYEWYLPLKILKDCAQESQQAFDMGDHRSEWMQLLELVENARKQWSSRNMARSCEAFFLLGQMCGELSLPADLFKRGLEALIAEDKRIRPLVMRNISAECCRELAQDLATRQWARDDNKSIRLAEMCEIIWAQVIGLALDEDFMAALPDKPSGLKPWLRAVAPDYARKGGAPKKK